MLTLRTTNNLYFDTKGSESLSVVLAPNNLGELNTRGALQSYDYALPLTNKNRNILSNQSEISCYLENNNEVIAFGTLYVFEINERTKEVSCQFIANNKNWFDVIKGKLINECSLDLLHAYTVDNIISSFSKSDGFIYIPAEWGYTYANPSLGNDPIFNTDTGDIAPAVYAHTLLRAILQDAGVTVHGELFNDATFLNTVIPFSSEYFQNGEPFVFVALDVTGTQLITGTNNTVIYDNISSGATDFFTTNGSRFINVSNKRLNVRVEGECDVTGIVDGKTIELRYRFNNQSVVDTDDQIIDSQITAGGIGATVSVDRVFYLNPNDVLNFTVGSTDGTSCSSSNIFTFRCGEVQTGFYINPIEYLPNVTQENFIRWVFATFGVIVNYNDRTKALELNLYKNVRSKPALNWSSKVSSIVSLNKQELIQDYAKNNYLYYEYDDEDLLIKEYTENEFRGNIQINAGFLDAESDFYTAPFSPTLQALTFIDGNDAILLPNIQRVDIEEARIKPTPRVLIVKRNTDVSLAADGFTQITITDGTITRNTTNFPYAYFYPFANVNENIETLSYSYIGDGGALNQILPINEYLGFIFDCIRNSEYVLCEMMLTAADIQALDFSTPIRIEYKNYSGLYLISSIDGFNGKGLTDVYLLKIV